MPHRMSAGFLLVLGAAIGLAASMARATEADGQSWDYGRLRCESRDGHEEFCAASIAGDVRVARQLSNTRCIEGSNWRWQSSGITVRQGCRAEFEYRRRGGGGWGSGGGWGGSGGGWGGGANRDRVTCQSVKDREDFCPAAIGGHVVVARQLSDTPCIEGRTWSWNRDGVRVRDGCRAEFEYTRRGGELNPGASNWQKVTCQSVKDREQFCPAPIEGGVRVTRQLSDTPCVQGRTWNWTRDGVRVWEGCRAEFEFRGR